VVPEEVAGINGVARLQEVKMGVPLIQCSAADSCVEVFNADAAVEETPQKWTLNTE